MQAELVGSEAMTCQELLALSGALSAALPTGQLALDSFLNSLTKGMIQVSFSFDETRRETYNFFFPVDCYYIFYSFSN